MKKVTAENTGTVLVKGLHIFRFFRMDRKLAMEAQEAIQDVTRRRLFLVESAMPNKEKAAALENLRNEYFHWKGVMMWFLVREKAVSNITTTSGRGHIAKGVAGTFTGTTFAATHCDVGDDNTAPAVGQTALQNVTTRKAISDGNDNGAQSLLETFFGTSEAVDTHEEYGYFMDGNDTDIMLNRFTETNVKSNTESMNVQSSIDFNDA